MKNKKMTFFLSNALLMIVFSICFTSFSIYAQNPTVKCREKTIWVWVQEPIYNANLGYDELISVQRQKTVTECTPSTQVKTNQVKTKKNSKKKSPYPNTVLNADGTIQPARRYIWLYKEKKNDFQVYSF